MSCVLSSLSFSPSLWLVWKHSELLPYPSLYISFTTTHVTNQISRNQMKSQTISILIVLQYIDDPVDPSRQSQLFYDREHPQVKI